MALNVGSNVIIEDDVEIGTGVYLGHNVILRKGTRIGNNTIIRENCVVAGDCTIGNEVVIKTGCLIGKRFIIEDNVFFGPMVVTSSLRKIPRIESSASYLLQEGAYLLDTVIKKYCILGAGCIIVSGVTIGPRVMIGAGSIVTKSIAESGVYYGNPLTRKGDYE